MGFHLPAKNRDGQVAILFRYFANPDRFKYGISRV